MREFIIIIIIFLMFLLCDKKKYRKYYSCLLFVQGLFPNNNYMDVQKKKHIWTIHIHLSYELKNNEFWSFVNFLNFFSFSCLFIINKLKNPFKEIHDTNDHFVCWNSNKPLVSLCLMASILKSLKNDYTFFNLIWYFTFYWW